MAFLQFCMCYNDGMETKESLQAKTHEELIEIVNAQQVEIKNKQKDIDKAQANITKIEADITSKENEITKLKEALHLALHARFGKKSEKLSSDVQFDLFNEAEDTEEATEADSVDDSITVPSHTRQKRGRKPLPDYLPRVQQIHDLPDDEKACACGCQLTHIGDDTSEQLEYILATVQVIQHVRRKYACKSCEEMIKCKFA